VSREEGQAAALGNGSAGNAALGSLRVLIYIYIYEQANGVLLVAERTSVILV
jgi:hypothetical protein